MAKILTVSRKSHHPIETLYKDEGSAGTNNHFSHGFFPNLLPKLQAKKPRKLKILLHTKHPSKSCLDLTFLLKIQRLVKLIQS